MPPQPCWLSTRCERLLEVSQQLAAEPGVMLLARAGPGLVCSHGLERRLSPASSAVEEAELNS